jgi:hypothetical protein
MPSLGADPLSVISRLCLRLNCDGANLGRLGHRDEPRPPADVSAYEWSDTEKEDLRRAYSTVTAKFSSRRDVEVHIQKEAICIGPQKVSADAESPLYILENISPMIRELLDHGDRNVKVIFARISMEFGGDPIPKDTVYKGLLFLCCGLWGTSTYCVSPCLLA